MLTALILAASLAAPCSWDNPGAAPYRLSGHSTADALKDYNLSEAERQQLKAKMDKLQYDDVVTITRDGIRGKTGSYDNLRDMHSKKGMCHGEVSRAKWKSNDSQIGLVYNAGNVSVVVPTVCNNVALLTKKELPVKPVVEAEVVVPAPVQDEIDLFAAVPPAPEYVPPSDEPPVVVPGGPIAGPPTFTIIPPGEPPIIILPPPVIVVPPTIPPVVPPIVPPKPPIIPAVPELSSWLYMLLGITCIFVLREFFKRKK